MARRKSPPPQKPADPPRPVPPPLFYRDGKRLSDFERGLETAEQVAARERAASRQARIDKARRELDAAQARYDEAQRNPLPAWIMVPVMLLLGLAQMRMRTLVGLIVLVAFAASMLKNCGR